MAKSRASQDKEALRAALVEEMRERGIGDIRLSGLLKHSGVPKSTFYTRYSCVADVVDDLERSLLDELELYTRRTDQPPIDCMEDWVRRCHARSDALLCLIGPNGDPYFEHRLRKRIGAGVWAMMADDHVQGKRGAGYVVEMLSAAYVAIMLHSTRMIGRGEELTLREIAFTMNAVRVGYHLQVDMLPRVTDERLYGEA